MDASLPPLSHCFLLRPNFPCWKLLWHQALSCYGRALYLLLQSLNLSALGWKSVISRLKRKLSCWSLLIQRKKTFILPRIINYMFTNPFWTPIKFTILSSIPNCSGRSSSHLEYAKYWLLSLPSSKGIFWPIDLSLPSLDKWHWSVCRIIQMQYLHLFFSARLIASSFTPETHSLEHGLVWRNNTRRLGHFL